MESPLKFVRRRRDERLLKDAILIGDLASLASRDLADKLWSRVGQTPRWRRARVTPHNARERLRESQDGLRYADDGRRLLVDRRLRRMISGYVREAILAGNRDEAEHLQELLDRGRSAPPDWESSGAWYEAQHIAP
ncbi:hypothetical protein [Nocardia suismassiliense]|uniref:hypothetical protein n=1 Tax=Nocardia suismassiliense TaxID=2077092 RepID=UPI000D1FB59B|nr:hypothetical protein [Nocardia suismassiliense]